jgi:hypothetical protein
MEVYEKHFEDKSTIATYWHNKSCDLMSSARVLWNAMEDDTGNAKITCYSTYKMLFGMSLETLFKAHCVAQKIDNPRINKSHQLTEIASIAGFKLDKSENKILDILSEYIIWDGRYPVPKVSSQVKRHSDNITATEYDKEKMGTIEILKPNGALDFSNVHKIWRRISDDYMQKYNQT